MLQWARDNLAAMWQADDSSSSDEAAASPLAGGHSAPAARARPRAHSLHSPEKHFSSATSGVRRLMGSFGGHPSADALSHSATDDSSGGESGPDGERTRRSVYNAALRNRSAEFVTPMQLGVCVCTWNVGRAPPPPTTELAKWLLGGAGHGAEAMPDVIVVGLQEVELGGASLLLEVTEAYVLWNEAILEALHEAAAARSAADGSPRVWYRKIEAIQLVGIVLTFIVQRRHSTHVTNVTKAVVRTGFALSTLGNKGTAGIRATIYGKRFLFIAAHFAAHAHNVKKRNDNFANSLANLALDVPDDADDEFDFVHAEGATRPRQRVPRGQRFRERFIKRMKGKAPGALHSKRLLYSHDYVFFFGDLNYRLAAMPYDVVADRIASGDFVSLLGHDELKNSMNNRLAFEDFAEAEINFPPTYKMVPDTGDYVPAAAGRVPAWTDRILFRQLDGDDVPRLWEAVNALERHRTAAEVVRDFGRRVSRIPGKLRRVATAPDALHQAASSSGDESPVGPIDAFPLDGPARSAWDVSPSPPNSSSPTTDASPHGLSPHGLSPREFINGPRCASSGAVSPTLADEPAGGSSSGGSGSGPEGRARPMRGVQCVNNELRCGSYTSVQDLQVSDHRPVCARFTAAVAKTDAAAMNRVMMDIRNDCGSDGGSDGD
jgi:hypothetical protein